MTSDFTVYEFKNTSPSLKDKYTAGQNSRFDVVGKRGNGYEIQFEKIYVIPDRDGNGDLIVNNNGTIQMKHTGLSETVVYYVDENEDDGGSIENRTIPIDNGISSGPLIVPIKYRLDSGSSLDGEATVGYYAGYAFDLSWIGLERVSWVPFGSAGLTQVNVSTLDDNGNIKKRTESGITAAVGFFINNWDKVNIGFVTGVDFTGNDGWDHEGEPWLSFSVGLKH